MTSLQKLNEAVDRGIVSRSRTRYGLAESSPNGDNSENDMLVLEEPLEILMNGELISITMRTPGHDRFLAVGFLFSEGIIKSVLDIKKVEDNCKSDAECNIINVYLEKKDGKKNSDKAKKLRRGTLTTAACGVCGRQSIDDMLEICEKQSIDFTISKKVISQSTEVLSSQQANFSKTGGCHGSVALTRDGSLLASYEDIGRHNAVDKTIGDLIMRKIISRPLSHKISEPAALLVVSGRLSFEIVQKCAVASIPVIASVSAPSSLAVDLADEVGITITSFVRNGSFSLYTHPERIQ